MSAWASRRRRAGAGAAGLAAAGLAAAALAPGAGAATAGTATLNSEDPSFSPPVMANLVGGGTGAPTRPGQGNFSLAAGGSTTARSGWSVDPVLGLAGVGTPVVVKTAADGGSAAVLATAGYLDAQWLIAQASALIAAAPNQSLEAGAIATAVWVLTGQAQAAMPPPTTPR